MSHSYHLFLRASIYYNSYFNTCFLFSFLLLFSYFANSESCFSIQLYLLISKKYFWLHFSDILAVSFTVHPIISGAYPRGKSVRFLRMKIARSRFFTIYIILLNEATKNPTFLSIWFLSYIVSFSKRKLNICSYLNPLRQKLECYKYSKNLQKCSLCYVQQQFFVECVLIDSKYVKFIKFGRAFLRH